MSLSRLDYCPISAEQPNLLILDDSVEEESYTKPSELIYWHKAKPYLAAFASTCQQLELIEQHPTAISTT